MSWSRRRAIVTGLVTLGLVGVATLGVMAMRDDPEPQFCTTGLSVMQVDGVSHATEDQGAEGDDGCDLSDGSLGGDPYRGDEMLAPGYVGFDCRLHRSDDDVSADTVIEPNHPDGSCG
jgi:hypothetical protein